MMWSTRAVRVSFCAASLLCLGVAGITPAVATSGLANSFSARYPSSTTRTAAGCSNTCHGGSTSNYNAYGRDLRAANGSNDQRLAAIENLDSDKEGNSNLVEITKNAQPGWCVATAPGCDNNGRTPPSSVTLLDPASTSTQPPVANAGGPYTGAVNVAINFNGAASRDPDGSVVSYLWNFGDNTTASGVTAVHAYAAAGSYTVRLTVTDNDGLTNSASTTAQVSDGTGLRPPVANPAGPYQGTTASPVAFDGSASSDPDGTIVSYDWTFGDGGTASGPKPTHAYSTAGTYTVTLKVTDDTGRTATGTTTASIQATNSGEALYGANCASCHGDPWSGSAVDSSLPGLKRVTGARSCSITGAIFGTSVFPQGVPDMVAFGNRQLTTTQIDAISVYLNSRTVTGEQRYVATCAGCHGNDGRGGRVGKSARGENANGLAEAIRETRSMQFLGCLPSSDIQSTATFLGSSNSADGGSDDGGGGGGGGSTGGTTLLGLLTFGLYRAWRTGSIIATFAKRSGMYGA